MKGLVGFSKELLLYLESSGESNDLRQKINGLRFPLQTSLLRSLLFSPTPTPPWESSHHPVAKMILLKYKLDTVTLLYLPITYRLEFKLFSTVSKALCPLCPVPACLHSLISHHSSTCFFYHRCTQQLAQPKTHALWLLCTYALPQLVSLNNCLSFKQQRVGKRAQTWHPDWSRLYSWLCHFQALESWAVTYSFWTSVVSLLSGT